MVKQAKEVKKAEKVIETPADAYYGEMDETDTELDISFLDE